MMRDVTITRRTLMLGTAALGLALGPVRAQAGLPLVPHRTDLAALGHRPGKPGGTVRMLIGSARDVRLIPIISYARLVGYDDRLNLRPDILESCTVEDERIFTLRLREGHRWSDGSELTSEDFRYCWEDVWLNKELHPSGPVVELLHDGKLPQFEVLDRLTVRFAWAGPKPDFLPALAAASPVRMLLPAAYMRQFHARYQDPARLDELIRENRVKDWVSLHQRLSRQTRPENPDLPTLEAWMPRTAPPAEQFVFERNPYFHRIDENGVQLPYLDRIVLNVSSADIIPAKTGAGESDLQFLGLVFSDYTFIKGAEKRFPIRVSLWKRIQGSRMTLLPNLNCNDPVWRGLFRDARVRRALSVAINRREINMAVFYGLAAESADTVLPESALYKPEYASAWTAWNVARANRLLDEAGLEARDSDGFRLLPDGRMAQIVVETAGESTLETDVLELVADHWRQVGISLLTRATQRDLFRARGMSGDVMVAVWQGMDNGVPTPDMSPAALAPTSDDQMQWPLWGLYYLDKGAKGEPPDLPEVQELVRLYTAWRQSTSTAQRREIWQRMLEIHADQVFSIGIVNGALQPVVSARALQNVPQAGLFGYDPQSYLGVYRPDTFWYDPEAAS